MTDSKLHRGNTLNGAYKLTLTITSLQVDPNKAGLMLLVHFGAN